MNGVIAIARRELKTFFNSPIAYIVLGGFLLLAGWLFFSTLFLAGQASLRGFFGLSPVLFMVLVPAITMRALADERKSGTMELLLTLPLPDWQITLGKFLGALGMVAVGLAATLPWAISVAALTGPGPAFDWGPVVAGYGGLVLLASAFIGLGLWGSALSKNQIVGFIVGLLLCFAFYFVDKFAPLLPDALGQVLEFLSVDYHFDNIARGVVDTRDLVFYVTLTIAGLGLTTQTVGAARR
jgi:ABC-2 type transport system permease protein